jgi:hypothetical protein
MEELTCELLEVCVRFTRGLREIYLGAVGVDRQSKIYLSSKIYRQHCLRAECSSFCWMELRRK